MGLLKSADKEIIKRALPKASNKIIDVAIARLYIAYPDPNEWLYTGLAGALVLVDDVVGNTFFLKLVDISGHRGVIWDQELYVNFEYNQDRTFLHTFELDDCYAGLLFEDLNEASHFLKRVQKREKYGSKKTLTNKNAIALTKKINEQNSKSTVHGPRGEALVDHQRQRYNYADVDSAPVTKTKAPPPAPPSNISNDDQYDDTESEWAPDSPRSESPATPEAPSQIPLAAIPRPVHSLPPLPVHSLPPLPVHSLPPLPAQFSQPAGYSPQPLHKSNNPFPIPIPAPPAGQTSFPIPQPPAGQTPFPIPQQNYAYPQQGNIPLPPHLPNRGVARNVPPTPPTRGGVATGAGRITPPAPPTRRGPAPPPPPHRTATALPVGAGRNIPAAPPSRRGPVPPPPPRGSRPMPLAPGQVFNPPVSTQYSFPEPTTFGMSPPPAPTIQMPPMTTFGTRSDDQYTNITPLSPMPTHYQHNANAISLPPPPPPPPPPPAVGASSQPPPPPPPPPAMGGAPQDNSSNFVEATGDTGRDALLASIRGAGLGSLRKVDKAQLDKPSVLLSEARGEPIQPAPKTASNGAPASMADALAAALNKRKAKVNTNDDYDNGDDW